MMLHDNDKYLATAGNTDPMPFPPKAIKHFSRKDAAKAVA
jgi:hypothetical protein